MCKSPKEQRKEQDEAERIENERLLSTLNERQKRTFLRQIERGDRDAAVTFALSAEKKSTDDFSDDDDSFSSDQEEEP
jgi:hypothetical protein